MFSSLNHRRARKLRPRQMYMKMAPDLLRKSWKYLTEHFSKVLRRGPNSTLVFKDHLIIVLRDFSFAFEDKQDRQSQRRSTGLI